MLSVCNVFFCAASNPNMTGTLPSQLGQLNHFRWLDVDTCGIGGTIPPGLAASDTLDQLYLDGSHISGTVPPVLWRSQSLRFLLARNTLLAGELANCTISNCTAFSLPSMNTLDLRLTMVSGVLPEAPVQSMPKLQLLSLRGSRVSGTLSSSWGNLTALESLITPYMVSGTLPVELAFGQLQTLEVSGRISGTLPAQFVATTSSLRSLSATNTSISGSLPPLAGRRLQILTLSFSARISGVVPAVSPGTLRELHLRGTQVSGFAAGSVDTLRGLSLLDLRDTNITSLPSELASLSGVLYP